MIATALTWFGMLVVLILVMFGVTMLACLTVATWVDVWVGVRNFLIRRKETKKISTLTHDNHERKTRTVHCTDYEWAILIEKMEKAKKEYGNAFKDLY